jgi:hypothetical protein
MFLISVLPKYHVPDMIGFVCITYIFPCTLLLSVINLIATAIMFVCISKYRLKGINIKLILSAVSILTTYVTMLIVHYAHFFDYIDSGVDYLLLCSYVISIISGLFFYRLIINDYSA